MASRSHWPSEEPHHPSVLRARRAGKKTRKVHRHVNPVNGCVTCEIELASISDLENAVRAARAAFPAWRVLAEDRRRDLMLRMATLIECHAQDLIELSILESGCPSLAASSMVAEVARRFRHFAVRPDAMRCQCNVRWGAISNSDPANGPDGVIGAIIPRNGSLLAAVGVLLPTLAAGNCMVMKMSKLAPFSVMRLGGIFAEAGVPPGIVNLLTGGPDIDRALALHPQVARIHFVGRPTAARRVARAAADVLKPCHLELVEK